MKNKASLTLSEYKKQIYQTPKGILTGWLGFDTASFGFFKGELTVFGGRPGTGKTDLLIRLALWLEQAGENILFAAPEQDMDLLVMKFDNKKNNADAVMGENFNLADKEKIELYLKKTILVEQVDAIITESKKARENIILMIDNFTSLDTEKTFQKEHYRIQYIMQVLKACTLKHKIPIITSVGLNRKADYRVGDRRPFLSDLRGSGEIEELADKVGLIYLPMYYGITEFEDGRSAEDVTEINFAKNSFTRPRVFTYKHHFQKEDSFDNLEYDFEKHIT